MKSRIVSVLSWGLSVSTRIVPRIQVDRLEQRILGFHVEVGNRKYLPDIRFRVLVAILTSNNNAASGCRNKKRQQIVVVSRFTSVETVGNGTELFWTEHEPRAGLIFLFAFAIARESS
jgi:hypothetical protein